MVFSHEPEIRVGLLEGKKEVEGFFTGPFIANGSFICDVPFVASFQSHGLVLNAGGKELARGKVIEVRPMHESSTFSLNKVGIGRQFHWEREEKQTFLGTLVFCWREDGITVINRLPLEHYLESVVSSEMNDQAPEEFLKAHAVMARSWAGAILVGDSNIQVRGEREKEGEIVRWYGRETHEAFDVCGDDHCQRYQGLGRLKTGKGARAVRDTRGWFLSFRGRICDARYHKSCGGRTENFSTAWGDEQVPYLVSVSCGKGIFPSVTNEKEAEAWILSRPAAFCGVTDDKLIRCLLNEYDRETGDFFRWEVRYGRQELSALVRERSGIDLGLIESLRPLARGPSGRIYRLKIRGEKGTVIVGKELEIRRWLSKSHLLSSAFIVKTEGDVFRLIGAGWGHGVGLCQVGAAVMAASLGWDYSKILKHYFPSTTLCRLY